MGIAQSFNKAIDRQLAAHAAWMPIVNAFKIGDYGVFKDGVFQSLGNVRDKYPEINFTIEDGPPADIDFASEGTKSFKFDADGNATTSFTSLGNLDATLKFVFESADSCVIKAKLTCKQLKNVEEIGKVLAKKKDWRNIFSVVSKTYTGEKCVIICAKEAGTEVSLQASADLLKQVEIGKVEAGIGFTSNRKSSFNAIGETGIVALSLFKLNLFGNVKVLEGEEPKFEIEEVKGEVEDDF
jgi:hypothetical protein